MPGSIVHLAVARELKDTISRINDSDEFYRRFRIGNILPDILEESDKLDSHYWDEDMYRRMARSPIMKLFYEKNNIRSIKELFDNPVLFGYFCHLVCDKHFIEDYWKINFVFYDSRMQEVDSITDTAYFKLVANNQVYNRYEFLSEKMYYGDYDIIWDTFVETYDIEEFDELDVELLESISDYNICRRKFDLYVYNRKKELTETECRALEMDKLKEFVTLVSGELRKIISEAL